MGCWKTTATVLHQVYFGCFFVVNNSVKKLLEDCLKVVEFFGWLFLLSDSAQNYLQDVSLILSVKLSY